MNKNDANAIVQAAVDALGPSVREEEVDFGSGNVKKLTFRRLPYLEMDQLRLHAIGEDGKFSKDLHVGANARLVSRSLCDDTGTPFLSEDNVANLPAPVVDALAKAAQRVNGLTNENREAIAKKSETAESVG